MPRTVEQRLGELERRLGLRAKLSGYDSAEALVGVAESIKAGANITLAKSGRFLVVTGSGGGSGGHTIQDDNANLTARTNLSFQDGFTLTDDAGGDQTEVDLAFAVPAIVLGTAAAAGSAITPIRSDATIIAFDATVPTTQAFGDAAATGAVALAARRDHKHGMPTLSDGAGIDVTAGNALNFLPAMQWAMAGR